MSLLFVALASVGLSVLPQETPAPAAKQERKICKTETDTGSRMGARRVCHTEAEWRSIADQTGKDMDRRSRQDRSGAQ